MAYLGMTDVGRTLPGGGHETHTDPLQTSMNVRMGGNTNHARIRVLR